MNFVKNNWKKLTFASACLGYGGYHFWWNYEVTKHMRQLCEEVVQYAEKADGSPKRVLVVMNPVAKNKKTEKLFQKYCEPLLHLAGYSVDIVKTTYVGHAKSVIESLNTMPDAIVVAGGDGTSSEVVTGLMRRQHEEPCPVVFLPLGTKNETAKRFLHKELKNSLEYTKSLSTALMPMVYEQSRPESIIKFDVLDGGNESAGKAIYGLTRFSWGLLRDLEAIKDKYWYFGFLRHDAAVLLNAFSSQVNWKFTTDVEYTPPCAGCSNCALTKKTQTRTKPLLMKLMRSQVTPEAITAARVNSECSRSTHDRIEANQLNITCAGSDTESCKELQTQCVNSLEPGLDFVKNLPKVTRNNVTPSLVLHSRTIQLTPNNEKTDNQFFSIDGEEYEIRPIRVSLIPNAIKVYC